MSQPHAININAFPTSFGWSDFFQASLYEQGEQNLIIGRVVSQTREHYEVQVSDAKIQDAVISGKLRKSGAPSDFPAVGDWVAMVRSEPGEQASIHRILKRKNTIQRRRSGSTHDVQLMATNIDFMLVVSSCNEDFDLERLGGYFDLGQECGCTTVLLLTKSDLCKNPDAYIQQIKTKHENIKVLAISNKDPQSLEGLKRFFSPGVTSLLVGSSGVGKSTLTNFLLGNDTQKIQEVGATAKGRHTTTARYLRMTKWGGLVIDTPGMLEVKFQGDKGDQLKNFSDIEQLTLSCKFTNCQHKTEPGCHVKASLKGGELTTKRWEEYLAVVSKSRSKPYSTK